MNILISVNSNYLDKAKTMLYSLYMNTSEEVTVYLININLSEEQIKDFEEYLFEKCHIKMFVVNIKYELLKNLPIGNFHFSIEMYSRIFAQFLLPKDIKRVLWLDSDIIVMKNLSDFYNQSFDDKCYIVCKERFSEKEEILNIKKKLKLPDNHNYFNSGVLLINLEKLRKETDLKSLLKYCDNLIDLLTYPDQDLLNCKYFNKVKYADWRKYNYQLLYDNKIDKHVLSDIYILHYCGPKKPWIYTDINDASKYYWRVRFIQGYKEECKNLYKSKIVDQVCNGVKFKSLMSYLQQLFYVTKKLDE